MKKRIALKALLLSIACVFLVSTAFAQTEILSQREVDTRAQFLHKEHAKYTKEARKNGIGGVVVLSVVLTADGNISNIHVVRGLPDGLSESAIEAAKKIKFKPAIKNGVPVSTRVNVEYSFNIYKNNEPLYNDALQVLYFDYGESKESLRRLRWSNSPPRDSYIDGTQLMHRINNGVVNVSIGMAGNGHKRAIILNVENKGSEKLLLDTRKIHFWLWDVQNPFSMPIIITSKNLEKKEYEINAEDIFKKEIQIDTKQSFKTFMVSVKVNGTYYEFPFDK